MDNVQKKEKDHEKRVGSADIKIHTDEKERYGENCK